MPRPRRALPVIALAAAAATVLAGCATTDTGDDGRIRVVAVTDVYGDVVAQIGGDRVEVTSIIAGAAVDPHEYEASTRDQLAIAEADLVIVNGGGLDDFMDRLIDGSGTQARIIDAVEVSGLGPGADAHDDHAEDADGAHTHDAEANEHVWYSIHGMEAVAEAITAALVDLDPAAADAIEASSADFLAGLDALHERAHELEGEIGGADILATESVSAYLLADLGLVDVTPAAFLAAVQDGRDIGVGLLDEVLGLIGQNSVRMLAANAQAGGREAEQIRAAATAAGVPVVTFSETLPSGEDYLSWMSANLDAIASALR